MDDSWSIYSLPPSSPPSPTDSPSPSPPPSPTHSRSPSPSPKHSSPSSSARAPPPPSYSPVKRSIQAQSMKPMEMDDRTALERAIREMKECKDVFTSWRRYIDNSTGSKPCDLERRIRSCIDELENNSLNALKEAEGIARAHMLLSILMLERLSTESPGDGPVTLQASTEVIATIEEIQQRSEAVSQYAGEMQDLLRKLVEILEQGVPKKKKKFRRRLFGWIKKIFRVASVVLSALSAASLTVFHVAAPALHVGSKLAKTVAAMAGELEKRSAAEGKFDKLLALLRDTIPAQANMVASKLSDFQYCHSILRHEMDMQKGIVHQLDSQEADEARLQWATHFMGMRQIRF